jgi:hypothetical protein
LGGEIVIDTSWWMGEERTCAGPPAGSYPHELADHGGPAGHRRGWAAARELEAQPAGRWSGERPVTVGKAGPGGAVGGGRRGPPGRRDGGPGSCAAPRSVTGQGPELPHGQSIAYSSLLG